MQQDFVLLVDEHGSDLFDLTGKLLTVDKVTAHRYGLRHRAVSIFVFNHKGEILLQQRAPGKYHSAGKWSNTCCTHPLPGESPLAAAERRLVQEMGLDLSLAEVFTVLYRVGTDNGFVEHEFDHVFLGLSDLDPKPSPIEVSDWKWVTAEHIKQDLIHNPERYSPWLPKCLGEVLDHSFKSRQPQRH